MVDVDNSLQRKSTRILFVPDPHSIGIDNPNFTRHSDAVAEFIDNSIQACAADSFESTIYVGIFVQSSRGFLVIADHGQGMNEAGLKNFATFALSKEFRGERPKDDTERTFIGKFGVGAKQGGFFLGDRIRALTRSSAAEAGDGWLCFTLDAEELIRRQRNNQNVYEGEIVSFSSAEEVLARDELECADLVRHVNAHVAHASGHGAIFVIRMKPSVVDYFRAKQNCQEFERQLADIHYFHLHPAHRPNLHAGRRLTAAAQLSSQIRRCEVEFEVFRPGHNHKSNFSEVPSFPRLCFDRAQSSLPFILTVPVENAASQTFDINGIVQYFPFQEGQETRPPPDASDGGDDGIVFRVFWQDRALPEAKVAYLPFLPEQQREISKLVDSGAAAKWKRRLVVFLFLDWKFQCISNNKLKITQADFDVRLRIHKRDILFHPSTLKKDFDKWLVDCSKTFDHEFQFSDRVMDLLETRHMIFHAVQALGREGTFARGQKVSVCDTQSKEVVYGVVEDFVVKEHLPIADSTFTGTGTLRYRRVPEVLFGERLFEANLSKIELKQVTSAELNSYLTDSKPTQIELFLVEPNLKPTPVSTNAPLFRCSVRYALGVKLTRGKNKDTFFPEKAKDFVYGVSLALASDPDAVLARSNELSSNEAESSSSSRSRLKLVVLSDVAFSASGKIALLVRVHSNDFSTQLLEKVIDVRCVTTPPKTFAASFVGGAQSPSIRLGSALPSVALVLHDADGNVIQYDGDLCVCASCDSLDVQGGDFSRGPQQGALTVPSKQWQLMPSSRRAHLFEAKGGEGICGRIVSVLLEASVRPLGGGGGPSQSDGGWKSIGSCSLSVELHPGAPKSLQVLAPEDALHVKCGEIVSRLVVGCADQWGNATAPLAGLGDGRWAVTLGSGPLQPVPKAFGDGPVNFRSSQRLLSQTAAGARDVSDWPIDASGRAELLQLRCSESTLFAQEVVQELLLVDGRSRSALSDALRLAVTVLPECSPNALQLSLDGSVVDERFEFAVSAGGVVKGICFRILDENGQAMDLSPYRALEKSHLTIALYPEGKADRAKRKNISLPEANVINAVKAPKSKGVHHLEIAFTLAGLAPLKQIVVIRVQPNAPKAWRIKTSKRLEDGLLMQDPDDLASKLEYVFCVDEFDNVTMLPDEAAVLREIQAESQALSGGTQSFVPPATLFSQKFSANQQLQKPVLRIHAANADASDDLVFTLTRCLAVEGYEPGDEADAALETETETQVRYLLPPGACIKGLPPESTLHITAESAQDSALLDIAEHTITAVLVGGDPVALRLFSLSYELDAPAPGAFAMEMSPFDNCDDLEVSVLDEHGGPASSLWTRKTTLRVVELLGPTEERELYAKKNFRKLPHVLRDFVLCPAQLGAAKGRAAEAAAQTRVLRFDMVCGGAAGAGDDSRELSAVLTLHVRASSHIAELLLMPLPSSTLAEDHWQLVRDGDEEKYFLHVTAAQAVPRLALGLRAADGSRFRVDKSALKASVSPGGWCDSVRLSELDATEETRLAAEHGCACVFALQVADFNPSRRAGRCTLTVKFDDPRALPPQVPHQRVLGVALVVAPAPFQELVMNEQRLNKALLHSAVESDRTFAPLLTAQLQDAFGNRISVSDDVFLVAYCVPPHSASQRAGDAASLVELWQRFAAGGRVRVDGCGLPLDSKTLLLSPGGELRYPSTPCALTQPDELDASQLSQPAAALSGHKRPQSTPSTQAAKLPRTPGGEREARDEDGASRGRQEAAAFLLQLGAVAALRRQSDKELAFHYLRLKDADAGFSDGRHEVRFSLIKVAAGSAGAPFDVVWERGVAFDYSSAETVELKSRRVISEGERARAELEEYQTLRNRQRELDDDFTTLLSDVEQDLDQDADLPRLPRRPAQEDLAGVQQHIAAALRQLEAQSARPPVRQTRFLRQRLPEDAVGYVVDLAYVAEQRDAEILSWAAGNWIDTIVVQREAAAVDLYQRQQRRAWAFETGGGESRRPGNLPSLERIGQEVGGNPRYMIDVLQLDVGREELRYRLFANVFQNFILVDTLQHALDLRRALRSRGANRSPTMYTLAGDRIPSSGQLDPTNRLTSELQAVFGSQDARQTPRYQRCQRILADTERVVTLRTELDDVEARLRDFDVKQLEQLVREADVERRRLRVK